MIVPGISLVITFATIIRDITFFFHVGQFGFDFVKDPKLVGRHNIKGTAVDNLLRCFIGDTMLAIKLD